MFSDKFVTNVMNPFVCLWSRVWVYVFFQKQQSDHPVCEQTKKLVFVMSLFSPNKAGASPNKDQTTSRDEPICIG